MSSTKTPPLTVQGLPINIDECLSLEAKVLKLINQHKFNSAELVYLLALLLSDVGVSIQCWQDPSYRVVNKSNEQLRKEYLADPTLGKALVALSCDIAEDWLKLGENS